MGLGVVGFLGGRKKVRCLGCVLREGWGGGKRLEIEKERKRIDWVISQMKTGELIGIEIGSRKGNEISSKKKGRKHCHFEVLIRVDKLSVKEKITFGVFCGSNRLVGGCDII